MAVALSPDYYLFNFNELITYVVDTYGDVLLAHEHAFHQRFQSLDSNAQKLYLRMLLRKGASFRADKLVYQEIHQPEIAAKVLAEYGFIEISLAHSEHPLDKVLPLFNRQEWLQQLSTLGLALPANKSIKRAELDLFLHAQLQGTVAHLPCDIYTLTAPTILESFTLLFFGNLYQDIKEFVLRDLGLFTYEDYRIDRQTRLFATREVLETHLEYYRLTANLELVLQGSSAELLHFFHQLPKMRPRDAALTRRLNRCYYHLGRQLERLQALDDALVIYRAGTSPEIQQRVIRILAAQNEIDSCLSLCQTAIEAPRSDEEYHFACDFAYRLAKKHQRPWPAPEPSVTVSERLCLAYSQSVEIAVCEYLNTQGECFYSENTLICGVFGLAFWPLIFAPCRGAFSHPFQSRPHDLYDHDMLTKRQSIFAALHARLKDPEFFQATVLAHFSEKFGISNALVNWPALSETLIRTSLERIPHHDWLTIFKRLWADLRNNRNGFPDLIYFPAAGGYQLIEVKGPGDRLQKNQLRWMRYFTTHHIPHRVIHVDWQTTDQA